MHIRIKGYQAREWDLRERGGGGDHNLYYIQVKIIQSQEGIDSLPQTLIPISLQPNVVF